MTTFRRGIATAALAAAALTGFTGISAGTASAAPTATTVSAALAPAAAVPAKSTKHKKSKKAKASSLDSRCRTGRVICVDKSAHKLRWVVDGKVRLELAARFGASGTPTRAGSFRIYWKDADHVSKLFGSSMPFSLFFDGGQAVHYSSDFAARGLNGASHGCVNIKNYAKMKELFHDARVGDKVVIYNG